LTETLKNAANGRARVEIRRKCGIESTSDCSIIVIFSKRGGVKIWAI